MNDNTETVPSRTYAVAGMTCAHCVMSVEEEVAEVTGVVSAEADLATGRLEVRGSRVSDEAVREAVAEAGYEAQAEAEDGRSGSELAGEAR